MEEVQIPLVEDETAQAPDENLPSESSFNTNQDEELQNPLVEDRNNAQTKDENLPSQNSFDTNSRHSSVNGQT